MNENEYQDRNLHEKINPIQFGSYLQSKLEFETMILNLGMRYDHFNPNFEWFDSFDATYNLSINADYDETLDPDGDQIDSNGIICGKIWIWECFITTKIHAAIKICKYNLHK